MESTADPAAIFGAAQSLWTECHTRAQSEDAVHLSECFSGMDGLMREVMRIATMFEEWACQHADFAQLGEVWPYYLEDHFGAACRRWSACTWHCNYGYPSDLIRVGDQPSISSPKIRI
jgi:hypothetical protein